MKTGTMLLIGGAGLAALLFGNTAGLFGGVEGGGGGTKKGTVSTGVAGVTPGEIQTVYVPQSQEVPQELFNPLEQFATALNLSDLKVYEGNKYSGTRTIGTKKKYIEGTYRPDLMGQLKLDPDTLQHYYEGDVNPSVVLYTEGSRDIPTKKEQAVTKTPTKTPTKFTDPGYKSPAWS